MELKMSEFFTNKVLLSLLLLLNLDFINSASALEQDAQEEGRQIYDTESYADNDDDDDNDRDSDDKDGDIVKKPFSCNVCGKRFNINSHLTKHKRIHIGEKPFECDVCGKRFNQNSHLATHKIIHTGEKPFECKECGKRFNQNSHLATHKRTHTGKKLFECKECNQSFSRNSNLTSHKRIHTGEKPFECDVCGKKFNLNSNLTTHKRTHIGEKQFECKECNQNFSDRSNLAKHKKVHEQVPISVSPVFPLGSNEMDIILGLACLDFMCSKCFNFRESEDDLKTHELSCKEDQQIYDTESYANNDDDDDNYKDSVDEDGDIVKKPFSYGVCNQSFNLNSHLTRHKKIHTGEKPFECDVRGKGFNQNSNLARHMRTHTGEKSFSCGVCNQSFSDSSSLTNHTKVHEQVSISVPSVLMLGSSEMDIISGLDCLDFMCSKCFNFRESKYDLKTHELNCTGI